MRALSRATEPFVDALFNQGSASTSSSYVCQRCIRRNTSLRRPSSAALFSTSSPRRIFGLNWGARRTEAVEAPDAVESLKPATTWEGLEWIGTRSWDYKHKKPKEEFEAYGPLRTPLEDKHKLREELLRAMLEVFVIKESEPTQWKALVARLDQGRHVEFPQGIRISCVSETLEPSLEFDSPEAMRNLEEYLNTLIAGDQYDTPTSRVQGTPIYQSIFTHVGDDWESISLQDLSVRFAVGEEFTQIPVVSANIIQIAKRIQQRTGRRLTDYHLQYAKTAGDFFKYLWRERPAHKLSESLESDIALRSMPHVKVHPRRIKPSEREKQIGRWKLIEEELDRVGIPPFGDPGRVRRGAKPLTYLID